MTFFCYEPPGAASTAQTRDDLVTRGTRRTKGSRFMKRLASILVLVATSALTAACGSDTGDGGGGSGSTSTNCKSSHQCINGACTCTTAGKDGNSCTDADACVSECKVCE